ncbi:MAG: fumarate hydratase [Clostridia bacterium]
MRIIEVSRVSEIVRDLLLKANIKLPEDVKCELNKAYNNETNQNAKFMLKQIIDNSNIAIENSWPMCQDTGMAVIFVDIGQEASFTGGNLKESINQGVRDAYKIGKFRNSVADPLTRINTKDNTPAIIHFDIIPGNKVKISVAPKGFGSENMSRLYMLNPTDTKEDIVEIVKETVLNAGGKPCPPIILGIGIGGTVEKAAILAKKSLLRDINEASDREDVAELENEILSEVNMLNVGAQGLGGLTTALAVNIETYPTHIAGLPVVINIQCHAARHLSEVI